MKGLLQMEWSSNRWKWDLLTRQQRVNYRLFNFLYACITAWSRMNTVANEWERECRTHFPLLFPLDIWPWLWLPIHPLVTRRGIEKEREHFDIRDMLLLRILLLYFTPRSSHAEGMHVKETDRCNPSVFTEHNLSSDNTICLSPTCIKPSFAIWIDTRIHIFDYIHFGVKRNELWINERPFFSMDGVNPMQRGSRLTSKNAKEDP